VYSSTYDNVKTGTIQTAMPKRIDVEFLIKCYWEYYKF